MNCLACGKSFERYVSPGERKTKPAAGRLCSRACRGRYANIVRKVVNEIERFIEDRVNREYAGLSRDDAQQIKGDVAEALSGGLSEDAAEKLFGPSGILVTAIARAHGVLPPQ